MNGSKIIHALLQNSRRSSLSSALSTGRISSSSPSVTGRLFNTRSVQDQHDRAAKNVEIGKETKLNAFKASPNEYGCPSVKVPNESCGFKDMPIQICSVEDAESDEATDDVEEWEEEDETEAKVGDGGDGGGVALHGVPWGERVLSIAKEVLSEFGDDMKLYAFKTSPRGYIYVRLDKVPNEYGCPSMDELESYSRLYNKRLDEVGAIGEIPEDLALEVSSPGAERILRVPTDLCRFKDMAMQVCYIEDSDSDSVSTKNGYFMLESIDAESESCEWRLADVRENREPLSKGRPLSRKRKDWRLKLPFVSHTKITLYLGNA